jgi:hypothetical protein
MSLFWLAQILKAETQLRPTTGRGTKRPSTLNDIYYFIFKRITKKIEHKLTYLFFFLQLQSSNFKALVISTSLVIGT